MENQKFAMFPYICLKCLFLQSRKIRKKDMVLTTMNLLILGFPFWNNNSKFSLCTISEIFYTIMHTTVAVLSLPKKGEKMWVPWGNFLDKFLTGRLKTKIWLGYYVCNHQDSGAYLYLHKKAFLWHESKLPSEKHIHFEYLDSYLPQYQSKFWEPTWLTFTFECWIEIWQSSIWYAGSMGQTIHRPCIYLIFQALFFS